VSKRTKDIWGRKGLDSETSYNSGLERGIGDLKARSRGVNTEPASHNSVERQDSVFVLLLNILAKK
jgi:hypothetical protein